VSTTRSKPELVRLAWLVELRQQGQRQHWTWNYSGGDRVCALQLLWELLGKPGRRLAPDFPAIGARAGLSTAQTWEVISLNDRRRRSFSEIADAVAAWFEA